jgi:hypothetical protein
MRGAVSTCPRMASRRGAYLYANHFLSSVPSNSSATATVQVQGVTDVSSAQSTVSGE